MISFELARFSTQRGGMHVPTGDNQWNVGHAKSVFEFANKARRYGYVLSDKLITALMETNTSIFEAVSESYIKAMKELRGGKYKFKTLHRGFIDDPFKENGSVNNFIQNIQYALYSHDVGGETVEIDDSYMDTHGLDKLSLWGNEEVKRRITILLESNVSTTSDNVEAIKVFAKTEELNDTVLNADYVHREIMATALGSFVISSEETANDLKGKIKSKINIITDVLRLSVAMSNGDTSLAEVTRFKKFSRKERKLLCGLIHHVLKTQNIDNFNEDLLRYQGQWKRLSHALHVGDYRLHESFQVVRDQDTSKIVDTFNRVMENGTIEDRLKWAVTRPSEFVRRVGSMLSLGGESFTNVILDELRKVAHDASINVLISARYHFMNIRRDRFVMPKSSSTSVMLSIKDSNVSQSVAYKTFKILDDALTKALSKKDKMEGKYSIHPGLYQLKVPTQQRNASSGLLSVARGSRIPMDSETGYMRLFIHWIGDDVDLSFVGYKDGKQKEVVYYGNKQAKSSSNKDVIVSHSGDFTYAPAPHGASEFIDIDVNEASYEYDYGIVYVNVYSGLPYSDMEHCVAGWCEIPAMIHKKKCTFRPSEVKNLVKIETQSRTSTMFIVDFKTNEIVWADVSVTPDTTVGCGQSVYGVGNPINRVSEALMNDKRISIGDLIERNIEARGGEVVEPHAEGVTHFSMDIGYDADLINKEFL